MREYVFNVLPNYSIIFYPLTRANSLERKKPSFIEVPNVLKILVGLVAVPQRLVAFPIGLNLWIASHGPMSKIFLETP